MVDFEPTGEEVNVSIIDFGMARLKGQRQDLSHLRKRKGKGLTWYAPELLRVRPVSAAADWYSVGVLMDRIFDKLYKENQMFYFPMHLRSLTMLLTKTEPKLRPSADVCLSFLRGAESAFQFVP